jgi:hypothetical protein
MSYVFSNLLYIIGEDLISQQVFPSEIPPSPLSNASPCIQENKALKTRRLLSIQMIPLKLAAGLPYFPLPWWERIQERGKRIIYLRYRAACCAELHYAIKIWPPPLQGERGGHTDHERQPAHPPVSRGSARGVPPAVACEIEMAKA